MNPLILIRNILYLLIGIFLAFIGLKFGFYGLIINVFGGELYNITAKELYEEGAGVNRFVIVEDAKIFNPSIVNWTYEGEIESYFTVSYLRIMMV